MSTRDKKNYCGFEGFGWQPPFWKLHNNSCQIHDTNYDNGGTWLRKFWVDVIFLFQMVGRGFYNFYESALFICGAEYKKAVIIFTRGILAILSAPIYYLAVSIFGWKTWYSVEVE